jgi:HTH-type transcriptional regulator/antitoxin HigA
MTAVLETTDDVRAALENLQVLMEQLRGQFVHGIKDEADYERAAALLDELTDGHELNKYEEQILIELEDAILAYEGESEQFEAFNAAIEARTTPVQLLKDLMETLKLTGSDLPEVGDKTVVSKVLNGERQISHKMAFALAERFGMDPRVFAPPADHVQVVTIDYEGLLLNTKIAEVAREAAERAFKRSYIDVKSVYIQSAGALRTALSEDRLALPKPPAKLHYIEIIPRAKV